MESRLQNGTFIYKEGFLVTKCALHLQNGILALQTGISDCNSSYSFEYDKEWLTKNRRIRFLMKEEKKNEDSYYTWSEP